MKKDHLFLQAWLRFRGCESAAAAAKWRKEAERDERVWSVRSTVAAASDSNGRDEGVSREARAATARRTGKKNAPTDFG